MVAKRKLLVVCGPTASGKTKLALYLAKVLDGEIVSADSRQVYKGMDIGTGKDLPKNSKRLKSRLKINARFIPFYKINNVKIWGYDLVEPTKEFSVAQYIRIARKIIRNIWKRCKLPILVGGTGLYIKGVVDGIPTAYIFRNRKLRSLLEKKSVDELFEILKRVDSSKAALMNTSDRKNPRRLIRAIEVSTWGKVVQSKTAKSNIAFPLEADSILFVGLKTSKNISEKMIKKRVVERLKQGVIGEIRELLNKGVDWDDQSMQALSYRYWRSYFEENRSQDEVIKKWMREEVKYAKRQLIWFKKDKRIKWFDVSKGNWRKDVEKLVSKWHNKKN